MSMNDERLDREFDMKSTNGKNRRYKLTRNHLYSLHELRILKCNELKFSQS